MPYVKAVILHKDKREEEGLLDDPLAYAIWTSAYVFVRHDSGPCMVYCPDGTITVYGLFSGLPQEITL